LRVFAASRSLCVVVLLPGLLSVLGVIDRAPPPRTVRVYRDQSPAILAGGATLRVRLHELLYPLLEQVHGPSGHTRDGLQRHVDAAVLVQKREQRCPYRSSGPLPVEGAGIDAVEDWGVPHQRLHSSSVLSRLEERTPNRSHRPLTRISAISPIALLSDLFEDESVSHPQPTCPRPLRGLSFARNLYLDLPPSPREASRENDTMQTV